MTYTTYLTVIVPALITILVTYISIQFVSSYMLESGVTFTELNKKAKILPSSGGVAVAFGFAIGILSYVFGGSFVYLPRASLESLFAVVISVTLIAFVGFLDDINVRTKFTKGTGMKDVRKGLKQWQKPLLTFVGAIPLVAINAGHSTVALPFIGLVNFGILYPIVIIPLAVVFVANAVNLLGGFDGMITGTTLIASLGFLVYSIFFGTYTGAIISGVLAASVFVMFMFHRYPLKILPGDSFTYGVGAALAAAAIIGNMEAFGLVIMTPFIIEFLLHLRGRFKTSDLGIPQKDGTLKSRYGGKIYSWTHVIMNLKPMKEWEVAQYMWVIEFLFVVLAFGLKFAGAL